MFVGLLNYDIEGAVKSANFHNLERFNAVSFQLLLISFSNNAKLYLIKIIVTNITNINNLPFINTLEIMNQNCNYKL